MILNTAVLLGQDFPFISVSPQCPEEEEHWDITRLIKLLDEVVFSFLFR